MDDPEGKTEADQHDERAGQLTPGRTLVAYQPGGDDPDHGHDQREGRDRRSRITRHQPVPDAVTEERRDDHDVRERHDSGRIHRRGRTLPAPDALEDQRYPEQRHGRDQTRPDQQRERSLRARRSRDDVPGAPRRRRGDTKTDRYEGDAVGATCGDNAETCQGNANSSDLAQAWTLAERNNSKRDREQG